MVFIIFLNTSLFCIHILVFSFSTCIFRSWSENELGIPGEENVEDVQSHGGEEEEIHFLE